MCHKRKFVISDDPKHLKEDNEMMSSEDNRGLYNLLHSQRRIHDAHGKGGVGNQTVHRQVERQNVFSVQWLHDCNASMALIDQGFVVCCIFATI